MFHVLISVELVPNDEFPNFLLLVTKSLCIATTFFSRQACQFNQSCPYTCFPQKHAETEGLSAFFSGLWGARSTQAQQSTISSIVTHTPHWAGTRTGEELLLESSSLSVTTPQKSSFSCRSLQCSRSRKQEHGRETRLSQLLSVFITFSLKDGTFKTTSLTIYKKTP